MIEGNRAIRFRIARRAPRLFAQRTGNTSKSKIVKPRLPSGHARKDVIDVKTGFLRLLRQPAVLAPMAGAVSYAAPNLRRHAAHLPGASGRAALSARRRSSDRNSESVTSPSASRRSAAVNGTPPSCRSRSCCKRAWTPSGKWNRASSSGISNSIATVRAIAILRCLRASISVPTIHYRRNAKHAGCTASSGFGGPAAAFEQRHSALGAWPASPELWRVLLRRVATMLAEDCLEQRHVVELLA